ncbi:MAG: cytochrome c [Terriglobales bacterium]
MKSGKLLLASAIGLCLALPSLSFAADGAEVYKAKCAMCHGAEGQGKVGPAVKGTSKSVDEIADFITKGDEAKKAPHKKPISIGPEEAKAVAEYVKSLK